MSVAKPTFSPLLGPALMTAGAAFLVLNDAVSKTLTADMPATQIIAIRASVIALISLILLLRAGNRPKNPFRTDIALRTIFAVGNVFAFLLGLALLPFAVNVLIDFTNILFVVLLAPLCVGEHLTARKLIAAVTGLVGAALILLPEFRNVGLAVLLPVLSALLGAGRELWTRRLRSTATTPEELTLFAAVGMFAVAVIVGGPGWNMPAMRDIVLAMGAGACQGLAMIFMAHAMFVGQASLVAPFRLTALIWAILLAVLWFGETASWLQIVGMIIVTAALILVSTKQRTSTSKKRHA